MNDQTRLTTNASNRTGQKDWPVATTVGELRERIKGRKGWTVVLATYGGGKQVEVRRVVNGYHGRRIARVACYDLA